MTLAPISRLAAPLALIFVSSSCSNACERTATPAPSASASASSAPHWQPIRPSPAPAPALATPASKAPYVSYASREGVGRIAGCRPDGPVLRAPSASGKIRLAATRRGLTHVVVAQQAKSTALVTSLSDNGAAPTRLPWTEYDSPPALALKGTSWLAAYEADVGDSRNEVRAWTSNGGAEALATGDRLFVADALCGQTACGILTSMPAQTEVPGAALLTQVNGSWRRIDIRPPGEQAWLPFGLLDLNDTGKSARVILTTKRLSLVYRVATDGGSAEIRAETPFGLLDAAATSPAVLVSRGAATGSCPAGGFPLKIHAKTPHTIHVPAEPSVLLARRAGSGIVLAWAAPESCKRRVRWLVYTQRLALDGTPVDRPIALVDADHVAMASDGNQLRIWLRTPSGLTALRYRCD